MLGCNFPGNIVRGQLRIVHSRIYIVRRAVITPSPATSIIFDRVQIGETIFRITYFKFVTTNLTIRITDLEHIHPFQMFLNELFFCYVPSERKSGEKAKTMSICKIFRTVITKVEISKIAIVPVITYTTGQSHVAFGNAILYIRSNINRGPISILTIFQCPTQMMCVECTIVL